jgi:uncharacterized protein YecE (DUF72 family)
VTDQQIAQVITTLASTSGGIALMGLIAKFMLNQFLSSGRKLRELEMKQALDMAKETKEQLGRVSDLQVQLRAEFSSMKERLDLVTPILNRSTERNIEMTTAFKGYVEANNERFARLERATAEVLNIGKELRLVKSKKPPNGGESG